MKTGTPKLNQKAYFITLGRIVSVKNNIQALSTRGLPYEVMIALRYAVSSLRDAEDTLREAYHSKAWPR